MRKERRYGAPNPGLNKWACADAVLYNAPVEVTPCVWLLQSNEALSNAHTTTLSLQSRGRAVPPCQSSANKEKTYPQTSMPRTPVYVPSPRPALLAPFHVPCSSSPPCQLLLPLLPSVALAAYNAAARKHKPAT
jgi:hypothetical protein